jgi:hypothetical protein
MIVLRSVSASRRPDTGMLQNSVAEKTIPRENEKMKMEVRKKQ